MIETLETIWTVGHSTRPIADFLALLAAHGIQALIDVRRFPASRRSPHFNQEAFAQALATAGIAYVFLPELGGLRKPRPASRNTAWRNAGFRGYADHMETVEFQKGMEQLLAMARSKPTVIMCAEARWWRCHRALIADYLKAQGSKVIHILAPGKSEMHPYTSAARMSEGKLSYAQAEEKA